MVNENISNEHKLKVAEKVYNIIKPFGKITFVFGGFAAYLGGSQRDINDIDLFIDFDSKTINFIDEDKGSRIMDYLSIKLSKEFGVEFTGLEVSDDCTLTTTCQGVEIDIACRPSLLKKRDIDRYQNVPIGKTKITVESPLSCVSGKGYAFVFRKTPTKKLTDLYDMISLISKNEDLKDWYTKLNYLKNEPYKMKLDEMRKNGKVLLMKSSLSEEFNRQLQEFDVIIHKPESLKIIRDTFGKKREQIVLNQISEFAKSIKEMNKKQEMSNLSFN